MMRLARAAVLGVAAAVIISGSAATSAATAAAAATSGSESLKGTIVFAGVPGTGGRVVLGGAVVAKGLFGGVGRYLEFPPLPTDPVGASRVDLVFRDGTLHLVSTPGSYTYSINLHNCLFTGTQQLSWEVAGGTGDLADATGALDGTVSTEAHLGRNPDGSCSYTEVPHEVDMVRESGTLSF